MRNALGPGTTLGYCTNVHAGRDLAQMRENLERYALAVKARVSPHEPMGIGLWFSATAARQLLEQDRVAELRDWLGEHGLLAYTLNGFPYGDFHDTVVKHRVYEPDWATRERFDYTLDLVKILAQLLPDADAEGSISTLPIGWPSMFSHSPEEFDARARAAAANLHDLVHQLARIELDTGKLIHVDLEPEPGCVLDTAPGVVNFFKRYLLGTQDDVSTLAYLRVCHDACHSAVMFESQAEVLATYRQVGIKVGKVQVSSAIEADVSQGVLDDDREPVREQLNCFVEPRFLHQTTEARIVGVRHFRDRLWDDLPAALREGATRDGQQRLWRVHYHVPIFIEDELFTVTDDMVATGRTNVVRTTNDEIGTLLAALQPDDEVHHFEVETYAWTVLPDKLQRADLSEGIAEEMRWLTDMRR